MSGTPKLEHLKIPLEDIKLATNNFSKDNFICQGGYGKVYKGQLPATTASSSSSGRRATTVVAVQRLEVEGGQGNNEFLMEIMMLASYKHSNLASLVGYCEDCDEKIIVYKHEARGSLDNYLAGDLPWAQRLQICLGAARGLHYLHTGGGGGLHRDIKSSNVWLDENWEAKISDFGLSKMGPMNDQQHSTFLVTRAAGTFGYVDPLYISTGVLTKESDVYSFGVVLFEVLCGRPAMIERYNDERKFLSNLAKLHYEAGKLEEIVAPSIRNQITPGSLQMFSTVAYQCLKTNRFQRPSMAWIIQQLKVALKFQTGCGRITGLWGSSTGGFPWSLKLENNQKLRKIVIDHEAWIYSIGFSIEDAGVLSDFSQNHGGDGGPSSGKISEVIFDDDEEIIGIDATVGLTTGRYAYYTVITSLSFVTNKMRHGLFGEETGTPFSVTCDVGSFTGFYGRAGFYLDGFGCYFKD